MIRSLSEDSSGSVSIFYFHVIAKRINAMRSIYQVEMDAVKAKMDRLWKVQNAMLKKQPVIEQ